MNNWSLVRKTGLKKQSQDLSQYPESNRFSSRENWTLEKCVYFPDRVKFESFSFLNHLVIHRYIIVVKIIRLEILLYLEIQKSVKLDELTKKKYYRSGQDN